MRSFQIMIVGFVLLGAGLSHAIAQEKGLVFAHRGGAHEFDENTIAAFKASYDAGLRGFETDVRMTKDGVLVILHDDTLQRTHGNPGRVEEMTLEELRPLRTKKTDQPIPLLADLLDFLADKPGLYVEFEMKTSKTEVYTDELLQVYCKKIHDQVMAKYPEGSVYVFTSFDKRPLRIIKELDPKAELMFITSRPVSDEVVKEAKELGVHRIGCTKDGTSRAAVRAAQEAGMKVTGWPGHNLQDYLLGVGLGLDAICSDIPVAIHTWKSENLKPLPTAK
ncbi:MAG: glycerophosphodiester phosphodiesterase [Verrucomicrobiota bacterium]|nr:glycerophosphodiester phosphodiesterase [Verrucomicrobiota bacterium]